jgi:hypothetical protein
MTVCTGVTSCGRHGTGPVRANRGAAGVDRVTLAFVQEQYGVARLLGELQADLRAGTYRPASARRVLPGAGHQLARPAPAARR